MTVSRTEADARLQESESRFRAVFENTPDGIVIADPATRRFLHCNPAFSRMVGYPLDELATLGIEAIHPAEALPHVLDQFERLLRGEISLAVDIPVKPKQGMVFQAEISTFPVTVGGKDCVAGVFRNVTERKQTELALRESHERLSDLTRRLIEVQEAERQRLARELHDELGQGLSLLHATLDHALRQGPESLGGHVREAREQAKRLIGLVQDFSLNLRPLLLNHLGLLPALVSCFDRFAARVGLHVEFQHHGVEDQRFSPSIETAVFRIVQEALTNVTRHAGVNAAIVRVWRNPSGLFAQIEDQGRGFDPTATAALPDVLGLRGIQERSRLLGGQVTIESQPGAGTSITVEFPLPAADENDPRPT